MYVPLVCYFSIVLKHPQNKEIIEENGITCSGLLSNSSLLFYFIDICTVAILRNPQLYMISVKAGVHFCFSLLGMVPLKKANMDMPLLEKTSTPLKLAGECSSIIANHDICVY